MAAWQHIILRAVTLLLTILVSMYEIIMKPSDPAAAGHPAPSRLLLRVIETTHRRKHPRNGNNSGRSSNGRM
jgi:hypothetical protein